MEELRIETSFAEKRGEYTGEGRQCQAKEEFSTDTRKNMSALQTTYLFRFLFSQLPSRTLLTFFPVPCREKGADVL